MEKDSIKIRAAVLVLSTALFAFFLARSLWSVPPPEGDIPAPVTVEVKGDVSRPGIYGLDKMTANAGAAAAKAGCRVEIPADLARKKLISGQSLEVLQGKTGVTIKFGRMSGAALLTRGLKLDLNSASLDDLLLIPRMHPKIAAAIIKRRRKKAWKRVDDLIEIRGVGPKTLQGLRGYLEISAGGARQGP